MEDPLKQFLGGHACRGGGDRKGPLPPFPPACERLRDDPLKHRFDSGAGQGARGAAEGEPDQRAPDRA